MLPTDNVPTCVRTEGPWLRITRFDEIGVRMSESQVNPAPMMNGKFNAKKTDAVGNANFPAFKSLSRDVPGVFRMK